MITSSGLQAAAARQAWDTLLAQVKAFPEEPLRLCPSFPARASLVMLAPRQLVQPSACKPGEVGAFAKIYR